MKLFILSLASALLLIQTPVMASFNIILQKDAEKWMAFELAAEEQSIALLSSVKDAASADKAGEAMMKLYAYRTQKDLPGGAMWSTSDINGMEFQDVIGREGERRENAAIKIAAQLKRIKDAGLLTPKLAEGLIGMKLTK